MKKNFISSFNVLFFICTFSLNGAEIIKGTVADQSTSFDFNINKPILLVQPAGSALFTSATQTPSDPAFTISRSTPADSLTTLFEFDRFVRNPFVGISPETLNVNGVAGSSNPIRGVATSNLTLFGSYLAMVLTTKPSEVFVQGNILGASKDALAYTSRGVVIKDASGTADSSGVRSLEGQESTKKKIVEQNGKRVQKTVTDRFIFAAVAPNGGLFGADDSGVALLKIISEVVVDAKGKGKQVPFIDILNAGTGAKGGNISLRFDKTTAQLKIVSDLASIADVVDMHWDAALKRLYIVTSATSGAGATDGVRAVVMGRLKDDQFIFDPIAPAAVFSGTDKIIGATGAGVTVSLSHVTTMHATTGLSYLIVAGNNGASSTTGNLVFAVPLVDKRIKNNDEGQAVSNATFNTDTSHGTLADVTIDPETFFSKGFFQAREFTTAATASTDVLTNSSRAAMIGAGPLPLVASSRISDLFVANDAVFATIQTDYDGGTTEPGLYKSQPIFDQNGVIIAWTAWKRVAGTDDLVQGAVLDPRTDSFVYLTTNAAGTVSNTMKRTFWNDGDTNSGAAGLASLLGNEFEKENGGVQGLFDFARGTTTFSSTAGEQLSVLVATGLGKIAFVETGRDEGTDFKPFFGSYSGITSTFTNGAIGTTFATGGATRAIVVSGGVITDLGPISAAQIATDGTDGFLAVGGVGGLAVLVKPDGSGWSSLTDGFGGLVSGMKFFLGNDYRFVRKLATDGTNLYVLTNSTFDRIDMTASNFATGVLSVTTLATPESIGLSSNDSFSDAAVSGELGLLATSQGLYRVGNGQDVSGGTSDTLAWTKISVPNAPGPATRLSFGTITGMNQDFGKMNQPGQLYLLAAYTGYNQAQLNRYIIQFDTAVDDNTVQLVPDLILKSPTFLMAFGAFRNYLLDDGAFVASTRSRNNMFIDGTFINQITGVAQDPEQKREAFLKFTQNESSFAKASEDRQAGDQVKAPLKIETTSNIANTVRSIASGAILVPGDFGLRVND